MHSLVTVLMIITIPDYHAVHLGSDITHDVVNMSRQLVLNAEAIYAF